MRLLSSKHSTAHAALAFANCRMTNWAALYCSQSSENRSDSAVLKSDSRALLTWERNIHWWMNTAQQEHNQTNWKWATGQGTMLLGNYAQRAGMFSCSILWKRQIFVWRSFRLNLFHNEMLLVVMLKHYYFYPSNHYFSYLTVALLLKIILACFWLCVLKQMKIILTMHLKWKDI